jgi:hypothetical protein
LSTHELTFCAACTRTRVQSWRGWPQRGKPIPSLEPISGAACSVCGGSEQISNQDIRWVNVHGIGNTGLPDHWELRITAEARYEKWGLPYFDVVTCSKCSRKVALSEYVASNGKRQTREECAFCIL